MQDAHVAVLDIGKTNMKLLVATADGVPVDQISRVNDCQLATPYAAIDVPRIVEWFLETLPAMASKHRIGAIIATAHGCTGHLCDGGGPVLPMMDYEAVSPPDVDAAYLKIAPSYAQTMTNIGAGANRIAKQLLWQQMHFAKDFARAEFYLTLPQYIAWRLGGRPASEITQIAAQSHLWAPLENDFSSVVKSQGWTRLFPPFALAGEPLGPVSPEIAARTGLAPETEILCGVHDSNANLFRYKAAGLAAGTIFSTGTWMIGFERSRSLASADPARAMVSNIDVDGAPVASSLTMAGREYAILAGAGDCTDAEALAQVPALLARGTFALPSFVKDDGLFPGSAGRGRIAGPAPATLAERRALAAMYVAFTAHFCLDALESRTQRIVIDGGFAANRAFAGLLAALRAPQPVSVSASKDGTALGAALLWKRFGRTRPVDSVALETVAPAQFAGLKEAALQWARLAQN